MSKEFENIEISIVPHHVDADFFKYSDGSSAVVSTMGAHYSFDNNSATNITVGNDESQDVLELSDLIIEERSTTEATTFERESDGYNKNAVDSYIHHIHSLLYRYGSHLKNKSQENLSDSELHQGISEYKPTRVDAILDQLRYSELTVAHFRKLLRKEREKITEIQKQNTMLARENKRLLDTLEVQQKKENQSEKKSSFMNFSALASVLDNKSSS